MRIVACGALAGEVRAVLGQLGLADAVDVTYLPANLHNRPERIVPALDAAVGDDHRDRVLVGYADCGTGGALDRWLADRPGASRLPGAHCYELFAGPAVFAALHDAEPGTFFLTDFLARHFDALVWRGLGLDRNPELRDAYFGAYTRMVLLSQSDESAVVAAGSAAADRLGLRFEHVPVGRRHLASAVAVALVPPTTRSDRPSTGGQPSQDAVVRRLGADRSTTRSGGAPSRKPRRRAPRRVSAECR